jgi:L-rhamnose isomerase
MRAGPDLTSLDEQLLQHIKATLTGCAQSSSGNLHRVVTRKDVQDTAYGSGWAKDKTEGTRRQAFKRSLDRLMEADRIGCDKNNIWIVEGEESPSTLDIGKRAA